VLPSGWVRLDAAGPAFDCYDIPKLRARLAASACGLRSRLHCVAKQQTFRKLSMRSEPVAVF